MNPGGGGHVDADTEGSRWKHPDHMLVGAQVAVGPCILSVALCLLAVPEGHSGRRGSLRCWSAVLCLEGSVRLVLMCGHTWRRHSRVLSRVSRERAQAEGEQF